MSVLGWRCMYPPRYHLLRPGRQSERSVQLALHPPFALFSVSTRTQMLTFPLSTGSGESGKSTIVKQMKIIHQSGFSQEELLTCQTTVYRNLVDSAQAIVLAMRNIGIDCETPSNWVSTYWLLLLS